MFWFFLVFFCISIGPFISSNVVSLTPSTNRKRCCENEVLMLSVRACLALGLALTGHCNGWIQKELLEGRGVGEFYGCNSTNTHLRVTVSPAIVIKPGKK